MTPAQGRPVLFLRQIEDFLQMTKKACLKQDLNLRPRAFRAIALTSWATEAQLVIQIADNMPSPSSARNQEKFYWRNVAYLQ